MSRIILILFFGLTSQWSLAQEFSKTLSPKKFKAQMEKVTDAVIVDVRTQEEVVKGFIPGAINIDFKNSGFQEEISKLDKNKTYFVYCAAGVRSAKAVTQMEEAGFKKIYMLDGGYNAWMENKLETKVP